MAENFYNQAFELDHYDVDYSIYQKGRVQGIQQKNEDKIKTLQLILSHHKNSPYYDKAIFEIGDSYFEINQPKEAIRYYNMIADSLPNSIMHSQALIQLGLIHYNLDMNDKALKFYKQVVEEYKGTPEEKKALTGIQNTYMSMNQPDAYFAYVEQVEGVGTISATRKDSLSYVSARNVYMQNDCPNAIRQFEQYLDNFPKGSFELEARYFLANCHHREKDFMKALESYQYVLKQAKNVFTEQSLLATARIHYANKNYQSAIQRYESLKEIAETHEKRNEAIIQMMRSYYHLEEYGTLIPICKEVLTLDKKEPELIRETHYKLGKSYYHTGRYEEAISWFTKASAEVNSIEGAESKYYLIKLYFMQNQYEDAKREIFDFIELNTGHRYWLAKSFLILADIHLIQDDTFQAIHTLKSVINNYEHLTMESLQKHSKNSNP